MSKEIDINNEEEILKECDFDYFYESENCSRELCMFYNDIQHQNADFNCKQAHIDLGRIAITLNKQQQRIAELEEQLKNAIVPKFDRQEHIYSFSFGKIKEFVVVAYLDNNITLCEDTTTSKLEWCDNNFLVLTKQEAETKLKELRE